MGRVKLGRVIFGGLVANLASFILGGGGYVLFGQVFKLEPVSIWRWTPNRIFEMSAGWWVYLTVGNTLLAIIVALAFAVLFDGIPGKGLKKGLVFGLILWFIGVLPATFTMNVLTVINGWAIFYFTTQALIEHLTYGLIIAAIYGEPTPDNK